ncbi:MAG TPA: hypothetical protein VJ738_00125 [Steroidobacteraceae bacterium]|nr:hypothetical protein [Steroidobacteraceae bacterium]
MRPWLLLTLLLLAPSAPAQTLEESVTTVWVHDVPGPPQGDFWHPVISNLFSTFSHPGSVYPNVMVCARPLTIAAPRCSSICWGFKGDSHGNGQPSTECQRALHVHLAAGDPRMLLEVLDMERVGDRAGAHAIIARNIVVPDPSHCPDDKPCKLTLPQGANLARGTLALSFGTEVHGVLGASPAPLVPGAPVASGGSAPRSRIPAWQPMFDQAEEAAKKWAQSKDPTAASREATARAVATTQADINACLAGVAHGSDTLRQRMPVCANTSRKDFESCMFDKVLYDDPYAKSQGLLCLRHYQEQVDSLGKAGVYVWLKGKICGVGQWIGLQVCQ